MVYEKQASSIRGLTAIRRAISPQVWSVRLNVRCSIPQQLASRFENQTERHGPAEGKSARTGLLLYRSGILRYVCSPGWPGNFILNLAEGLNDRGRKEVKLQKARSLNDSLCSPCRRIFRYNVLLSTFASLAVDEMLPLYLIKRLRK